MILIPILLMTSAARFAGALEVKLNVLEGSKQVGAATWSDAYSKTGKEHHWRLDVAEGHGTSQDTKTVYSLTGQMIHEETSAHMIAVGLGRNPKRRKISVKIALDVAPEGEASLTMNLDGKKTTQSVNRPAGAMDFDTSQFWFNQGLPKDGTMIEAWSISTMNTAWTKRQITYVGPKSVDYNGRQVDAQQVLVTDGERSVTYYFDAKGLPYVIETMTQRMVRQ